MNWWTNGRRSTAKRSCFSGFDEVSWWMRDRAVVAMQTWVCSEGIFLFPSFYTLFHFFLTFLRFHIFHCCSCIFWDYFPSSFCGILFVEFPYFLVWFTCGVASLFYVFIYLLNGFLCMLYLFFGFFLSCVAFIWYWPHIEDNVV